MDLAALEPGEALAVRRDGDLADGKGAVEAGKNLVEFGSGGGRRRRWPLARGGAGESKQQRSSARMAQRSLAKRERHKGMLAKMQGKAGLAS